MGFLDFEYSKEDLKFILSALRRRNLFMDEEDDWEIHGPHHDMDYQVYIGRVFEQPLPVYTFLHVLPRELIAAKNMKMGLMWRYIQRLYMRSNRQKIGGRSARRIESQ